MPHLSGHHLLLLTALTVTAMSLTACKAVELKPEQSVQVMATDAQGQAVAGLHCSLRNDKGLWELVLPGAVEVQRSSEPLHIECVDEGTAVLRGDVEAIDERKFRAMRSAKRYGAAGAILAVLFAGGPLAPAAIVYMATLGGVAGGAGAAGRSATDTLTDSGFVYPELIELRTFGRCE